MQQVRTLSCQIDREGDGYVSLCPELGVASEGDTIEQARANLIEAVELFFETADASEVQARLATEVAFTPIELKVGQPAGPIRQGSLRHPA
jgi:predicted RNase H-like HicB family nuclease